MFLLSFEMVFEFLKMIPVLTGRLLVCNWPKCVHDHYSITVGGGHTFEINKPVNLQSTTEKTNFIELFTCDSPSATQRRNSDHKMSTISFVASIQYGYGTNEHISNILGSFP